MSYMRGITERGIDRDPETGFLFVKDLAKKGPAEAYLDSRFERAGEGFWRVPAPNLKNMPASFVKTTTSGRASDEVIAVRKRSCFGTETTAPCPALRVSPRGSFCSECKCPQLPMARLDGWKITRAYLECPRGKPGFSNEVMS